MARAAFVMDRLMHVLGLHGKSFLPMLVGFGCTVPAIYATRTLENEDDRKLTGFLVPMMSCGARLPVYTLFAAAFFAANAGQFVFAMYITGIVLAIVTGMVMKRTMYKGKPPAPFVMELPPYRMPTWRGVWTHMWERTSAFVTRAFTIIMISSILIWALLAIPIRGGGTFATWRGRQPVRRCIRRARAGLQARGLRHLAGVRLAGDRVHRQGGGGGHDEPDLHRR
jgi:ferrous iron transport protein B